MPKPTPLGWLITMAMLALAGLSFAAQHDFGSVNVTYLGPVNFAYTGIGVLALLAWLWIVVLLAPDQAPPVKLSKKQRRATEARRARQVAALRVLARITVPLLLGAAAVTIRIYWPAAPAEPYELFAATVSLAISMQQIL